MNSSPRIEFLTLAHEAWVQHLGKADSLGAAGHGANTPNLGEAYSQGAIRHGAGVPHLGENDCHVAIQ